VLGGDLNLFLYLHLDNFDKEAWMPMDLVYEWRRILAEYQLADVYREIYSERQCYTFVPCGTNPHKVYKRLDYLFANKNIMEVTTELELNQY